MTQRLEGGAIFRGLCGLVHVILRLPAREPVPVARYVLIALKISTATPITPIAQAQFGILVLAA
jgi:hypothetical protein